jgi:hypothetical protein
MLVNLNTIWTALTCPAAMRDAIEVLGGNGAGRTYKYYNASSVAAQTGGAGANLFELGFGLSYTSFALSQLALRPFADPQFNLLETQTLVTVFVRDTEGTGFPASLAGRAHAVFLDLPGPHNVAAAAAAALQPGGMLCSFSPCIEQVQRLCAAAANAGLCDLRTVEVLDREHVLGRRCRALLPPPPAGHPAAAAELGKRKREQAPSGEEDEREAAAEPKDDDDAPCEPHVPSARWKSGAAVAAAAARAPAAAVAPQDVPAAARGRRTGDGGDVAQRAEPAVTSWPEAEARGHTGYLTFARKPV